MRQLVLNGPYLKHADGVVRLSANLRGHGEERELWFEVDESLAHGLQNESLDPFYTVAVMIAMSEGSNLFVDGRVSPLLHHNMVNTIAPIFEMFFENFRCVEVEASSCSETAMLGRGEVGTGISCGVDALATVYRHYFQEKVEGFRITRLLHNAHIRDSRSDLEAAKALFSRMRSFGEEIGLPSVFLVNNLWTFLPHFGPTKIHSILNLASAHALGKLFSKYYYSTGYRFEDTFVGVSNNIAYMDICLVPLLSTGATRFVSACADLNRVEKVRLISNMKESRDYLDVCIKKREITRNCSSCEKCVRTMFTLELLGKLHEYANVFDLEEYEKKKPRQISRFFAYNKAPYAKEIRTLAKEARYEMPVSIAARVLLRSIVNKDAYKYR